MTQDFGDDMENALLNFVTRHNPVSGTVYQGGNRVHLGFIGFMRGYTDNRWATFNQIKDAGWHVKKGAKSALIEKWKQFAFYKENEDTGEKELAGRYPKLVGYWNVFNAEDIEGIPPENAPVHQNDRTVKLPCLEACSFPQTSASKTRSLKMSSTRTTSPICNLG